MSNTHTVIVTLEAKQGKEKELEAALTTAALASRSEHACLEYRLHRNLENTAQFILYEIWESKEKHQEQFTKPYIKKLANQLPDLLANSFSAIYAEQL